VPPAGDDGGGADFLLKADAPDLKKSLHLEGKGVRVRPGIKRRRESKSIGGRLPFDRTEVPRILHRNHIIPTTKLEERRGV